MTDVQISSTGSFGEHSNDNNERTSTPVSQFTLPKMENGELLRWMREAEESKSGSVSLTNNYDK